MKVYQIIEKHFAVEKNIDMLLSTSPFATHTFTSMKRAVEKLDRIICFRMFQQREVYNPITANLPNVSHSYVAHGKSRKVLYIQQFESE